MTENPTIVLNIQEQIYSHDLKLEKDFIPAFEFTFVYTLNRPSFEIFRYIQNTTESRGLYCWMCNKDFQNVTD